MTAASSALRTADSPERSDASSRALLALPERLREFLAADPLADAAGSGPAIEVDAPFTGERLASFAANTAADVERKVRTAAIAARAWANRPVRERAAVLLRLHTLIRSHEELLLDVIQAENGKSRQHAYDEVLDAYNVCRYYGVTAPRVLRPQPRRGAVPGLTTTRVDHSPLGVVGFISPWNYPLSLGGTDLLAALAAGNAVVHKPDSRTPLSAVLVRRLAVSAGLPADVWQLVPGEVEAVSAPLLDGVDGLSFTGSTRAGRAVAAEAASRLLPTALELGGKNPMIVCADADLDAAVAGAVRGAFSSSGQLCLSIERIYVARPVFEEFCTRFAEAARALSMGAAFDYSCEIGTLTSAGQLDRVRDHVDDATARGARVLAGGRARPELGPYFFEPTVLVDVPESAALSREETFGPVVAVHPFADEDAAVRAANDTPYGLNASVFAGSKRRGTAVARRLDAGMVNVGEAFAAAWGSIDAPSGGVKASGLGHRHGPEGLLQFTRTRTIAHQALLPLAPSGSLTPERFQQVMTGALDVLRALRMK
ncbi:succinic semialdehyde dehydrogenase [Brevibacterium ihuae]|uniref:succinic semialdehyde dehydrogenase n=1 Tax=Brevibacterium ihuae TaxID=1631743 RepID=UPI000C7865CF|nr:succinic semialdehyde dehydrogenase [Brevibacterium ihuae]